MASNKTPVIDILWDMLKAENKERMVVYFSDVQAAIAQWNIGKTGKSVLSADNKANFMKDLVRSDNASANWPKRLANLSIGGRQRVGSGRILEFIPYVEGQTEPFPNRYMPRVGQDATWIQSVSLPLTSKSLGRKDESWLIQVAVNLKVIEQHFAVHSPLNVTELTHMQIGVKLAGSEVDSLFRAVIELEDGSLVHALVTCEAKQQGERILEHQIVEQIVAANRSVKDIEEFNVHCIIPVAIKAIPPNGEIYVVEFEAWTPVQASMPEDELIELKVASEGYYRLVPPVRGVGFQKPKKRKPRASKKSTSL